jgi:hypothetical protein
LKEINPNWGRMAAALSFFVFFPSARVFSNHLPDNGCRGDFAFVSDKWILPQGSTLHLSGFSFDLNNNPNNNITGLMFPGSTDVEICALPECDDFASSSQVKYDLNGQSHIDQPGQPFAKDPGGMAVKLPESIRILRIVDLITIKS